MKIERKKRSEVRERVCLEILRVSTPKQVELGGLESQHEDCLKIAEFRHVKLNSEQIRLPGISGKNVKHTPEIERLRELLRTGDFHGVVMVEDTRLMRPNEPEDQVLLQVFKDEKITIYTKTGAFDMGSPEGLMIFQMLSIIGGREREVIKLRTYSKRLKLRARGLCPSSERTVPYGITRVRYRDVEADRWAYGYDDAKINQVRRAFELVVEGKTNYFEIAKESKLAYAGLMRQILRNTAYIGYRTYDMEVDPSLDHVENGRLISQTRVRRPDDEIERVPMLGENGKLLPLQFLPTCFGTHRK
jgi:DNA invertase Pin-like site-specific DNA recombinase